MTTTENVEEDIVVDALESEQRDTKDREFILPGGQIIGLDQAVIQSIERCRTWDFLFSFRHPSPTSCINQLKLFL